MLTMTRISDLRVGDVVRRTHESWDTVGGTVVRIVTDYKDPYAVVAMGTPGHDPEDSQ